MNQTEQISEHLLKLLEANPELTIDMHFSPDGAFFLWTQLLLLRHHHANQSEGAQRSLNDMTRELEKTLNRLDPTLSKIVSGLQWENLLGATYSDLSPVHRVEFVKLQTLLSLAVNRLAAEEKAPPNQVLQSLESGLAQQRLKDLDVDRICNKSDNQLSASPDPYVVRKANALGLWNVGYYYYRSKLDLNFHLIGNYQEKRIAVTALRLLQGCYPRLVWQLLFVSGV